MSTTVSTLESTGIEHYEIGVAQIALDAVKECVDSWIWDTSAEYDRTLVTPLKRNMRETRPQWVLRQAMRLRRRIETAFGRLTDGFAVVRNRGRDFWRWSARVIRKVLAYNLLLRFGRDAAAA